MQYDLNTKIKYNGEDIASENIKKSGNKLIAMLEELLSGKGVAEKKHILEDEYGMIMTEELEGRMQNMCNLSELVEERGMRRGIAQGITQGIAQGITQGIAQERIAAVERMMKANVTKEQIISFGYTEDEIEKVESTLYERI